MTDVATCLDCLRPKASSADEWEALPLLERDKVCASMLDVPGMNDDALIPCLVGERDKLMGLYGELQAKYDALAAAHAKPSPELTAVEVAERAVVEAAIERTADYDECRDTELFDAVRKLLAERAKAGR